MKLCIFNNFELMTFYHVQGPKSCNFDIDKNRFKQANVSVFQCHLLISNVIHQVHMNLFNLDQSTMGQLCCMYPEACHDHWGGKPWFPIH